MAKPKTLDCYSDQYTRDCERVLVTLLRGLGPWKESVYLVGGLTPRYLVRARPPVVPAHAGTLDVDIVIDLQILADTEAYHTLEDNLRKMGFERAENDKRQKLSWRWQTRTEHRCPHGAGTPGGCAGRSLAARCSRSQPMARSRPSTFRHSSIVFDLHQISEIEAELLGGDGIAVERIERANLVSFTCLKAFAFDQRFERKDAHDLIYCIEHAPDGGEAVAESVQKGALKEARRGGQERTCHSAVPVCAGSAGQGYRKDGPVAVAKFELGESDEPGQREARALRQRQASDVIDRLLIRIG